MFLEDDSPTFSWQPSTKKILIEKLKIKLIWSFHERERKQNLYNQPFQKF